MPELMYERPPTDEMTFIFFYLIMDLLTAVTVSENHPWFQNQQAYLMNLFSLKTGISSLRMKVRFSPDTFHDY